MRGVGANSHFYPTMLAKVAARPIFAAELSRMALSYFGTSF